MVARRKAQDRRGCRQCNHRGGERGRGCFPSNDIAHAGMEASCGGEGREGTTGLPDYTPLHRVRPRAAEATSMLERSLCEGCAQGGMEVWWQGEEERKERGMESLRH